CGDPVPRPPSPPGRVLFSGVGSGIATTPIAGSPRDSATVLQKSIDQTHFPGHGSRGGDARVRTGRAYAGGATPDRRGPAADFPQARDAAADWIFQDSRRL